MKKIDLAKLLITISSYKCYYASGHVIILNPNCIVGMRFDAEEITSEKCHIPDLDVLASVRNYALPKMSNGEYMKPGILNIVTIIANIVRCNLDATINFHSEVSFAHENVQAILNYSTPAKSRHSVASLVISVLRNLGEDKIYYRECRKCVVFITDDAFVIATKLPSYPVSLPSPVYQKGNPSVLPPPVESMEFTEHAYLPGKFPSRHLLVRNHDCKILFKDLY